MAEDAPSVLIVDDDSTLSKGFEFWLNDEYTVTVVDNGRDALEHLSSDTDVVLLDREMPDMSGEEVLDEIRNRGYGMGVAMVTGVEPDFDILDMGFNEYLVKPVTKSGLKDVVEKLLEINTASDDVAEADAASVKIEQLEEQKSSLELEENSEYASLRQRFKEIHDQLNPDTDTDSDSNSYSSPE